MPAIQIPKFDSPAVLPADAVNAPDAPMVDRPSVPQTPLTPQSPVSQEDFLASVRDVTARKQEKPVTPDAPKAPEPKHDTTPPIFKSQNDENGEEEDSEPVDEPADDFVDPLNTEPVQPKSTKAKNIKELKRHLNTAKAREAQLRKRNEELEAETQRLSAFQERMGEFETLQSRVQELEGYERIFDIYNNPEFNAKYVEGAETLVAQAKDIATQYGVKDVSVIDQAVKITNRKELNEFLKKQGLDEYGISDIRPYIFNLQHLEQERLQLEKSPEEARETLSKMHRESEERRLTEVSKTIHDRSVNAWNQIAGYYSRGENAVDVFKDKPGDPEHTERRTAVLKRASDEYVKLMGAFAGLGVKDMPVPVAHALAARFQLSEWTGEFIAENKALKQQVADLQAQLNDNTAYTRPNFNTSNRPKNGAEGDVPKGNIASHVFERAREQVNGKAPR